LLLFSLDIVHIFVWFSNDRRLAIVVRVAAVFLILFILVIVGVLWRHRGADQAQREKMLFEMPGVMFVSRWMIMVNSSILRLAQQLRELGENGCDALRFVAREQLAAVVTRLLFASAISPASTMSIAIRSLTLILQARRGSMI
jgi:Ca2+/Na+ antiporter